MRYYHGRDEAEAPGEGAGEDVAEGGEEPGVVFSEGGKWGCGRGAGGGKVDGNGCWKR